MSEGRVSIELVSHTYISYHGEICEKSNDACMWAFNFVAELAMRHSIQQNFEYTLVSQQTVFFIRAITTELYKRAI